MNAGEKRLYEMKAEVLKAMAHPLRLALVDNLRNGEQCVADLAQHVGAERSNVSRHLSVLLSSGVLTCRKEGLMVYYRLATPCVMNFFSCVEKVLRDRQQKDQAAFKQL